MVITRTSAPDFYIDSSITPSPLSAYVSYQIVNNGTTNIPDMWVTITNFTGGKVSLGSGDPGQVHLGALAVGQTNTAFFYLTSTSGNSSTPQGHTIRVYNGYPTWGTLLTNSTFSLASVQETINASANKVNTVVSGPIPTGLGGVVTITVDADTGTLGNPNVMILTPACWTNWHPEAYAMFASTVTLSVGNTGTFTNQLYIPASALPSSASTHYVASYYLRAVSVTTAPTDVSPVGYITSGANVKHTDTTSFGGISPLAAPTNQMILTNLSVSTNLLYGGTVTYTVQFSNLGTNSSQLDEVVNSLPASFTYVTGSSTFNGVSISEPNISSSVLTWSGLFSIPAGTTRSLTFQATVPNVPGTYTNSVIGLVGNVQIDTTVGTTDNSPATITVRVPTNSVPSFTKGADQTVLEDSGAQSMSTWATSISAGAPAIDASQTVNFIVSNNNSNLFSVQPSISANGTLTYTSAANSNGTATVTVQIHDNGGTQAGGSDTSASQTFVITVTPVNDTPSFSLSGSGITVLEDAGAQTTLNWATNMSAGPPNESTQAVSFLVSNNNSNLFSVQPSISTGGTLTFTAAANSNGVATVTVQARDNGGTSNGGVDTSAAQTFTITVTAVNDAPVITAISNQTINEDAALQTINLTGIAPGPANESGQSITSFTATSSDTSLIPNPTVSYTSPSSTGTLTFTPVADSNGVVTITIVITDGSGTANGGVNSVTNTFTVTVNAVNDVPSFVKGMDIAVNQNVGAQTFPGWATSISKGPPNESGQSVDFIVSNNNNSLFSVQPTISSTGTLSFTTAGNTTGTATVSVRIHDDGGTSNGGVDTSAIQTFVIRVGAATLTTATGGRGIPADNFVSGTWTTLSGPTYSEGGSGDAGTGTIILNAPAGFEFDTGGVAPTVLVTRTGGSGANANNINGVASGSSLPITSISSTQITLTVTSASVNGVYDSLTWQNIRVRPTSGNLSTGIITSSGTATVNQVVSGVTSWGTISEIPGAATQLVFHTEPSATATAGVAFAQQPVIWIEDLFGNRVTSASSTVVTLSRDSSSGTGTLQGTLTGTAVNGVVTFSGINYRVAETILLGATSPGLSPAVSTSVQVAAAAAAKLAILTQPTAFPDAGVTFPQQPVVGIGDQYGNIILTDNSSIITVSRNPSTGTGTLYGTAGIQVVNGVATFTNLSYQVAETIKLNFDNGTFSTVTSDDVTIIAGPPVALVFVQQPLVETAGIIFSLPPIIEVVDAYGNLPTQLPANLDVTISLYAGSGIMSGTVVSNIGTAGGNGFITLPNLQINTAGDDKVLKATGSGVTEALSNPFVVQGTVQPYDPIFTLSAGLGPIGARLGNLRGLNFDGSTTGAGARWRDMIVGNYDGNNVMVRLCRDNGTFASPVFYPVGKNPFAVDSADFNRDGYEDIAAANFGTNTVSVLMNRGNATFLPAVNYVVGRTLNPGPIHIEFGNVYGDGGHEENSPWPRPEIITANYNEGTVSILHSLGAGKFAAPLNYSVGANPSCVLARDVNRDGLLDLIVANSGDGTIGLLYLTNRTNAAFEYRTNIAISPSGNPRPIFMAAADFNRDGIMDLVTANYDSNSVSILIGTANGSFTVFTNYSVGTHPRSVLARDINRDGKPDLVVANNGSATLDILLNVGDGTFVSGGTLPVGNNPMIVVGSNFNDDGATDIVVANYSDNTVSVLLYDGPLANNRSVTTYEDTAVSFSVSGHVLDGSSLSYALLTQPEHGTLSGTLPSLTYTPETNYYGTDSFQFRSYNSTLSSTPGTVSITVRPVDDVPSFVLASNTVYVSNFGALHSITNFARNISPGPANESAQTLSFILTVTNRSFFTTLPTLSTNGTLTFKPAVAASGTSYITVKLKDSTTTATTNSAPQMFVIVINNPFPALKKGTYNGLFYQDEVVSHYSSGFITFQLTDLGTFTGRLMVAGGNHSISGSFDGNGAAVPIHISRGTNTALTLNLTLDVSGGTDQVSGTVADGHWTASLNGDRAVYTGTTLAPQAGKYTLIVPGGDGVLQPGGDGYGVMTVSSAGMITVSGTLSDGVTFSQTVPVSKRGQLPLYLNLYSGKGSVLSWVTFSNSILGGDLSWVKTPLAGKYYPNGFTNESTAIGSAYVVPPTGTRILGITNGLIALSNGNLASSLTNRFTLATNNIVTVNSQETNSLALTFNKLNGTFSGRFLNPTTRKTATFSGAVLQVQNQGRGFLLDTNRTGRVLIAPEE